MKLKRALKDSCNVLKKEKKKTLKVKLKFAQIVGNEESLNLLEEFYKYNENSEKDITRRAMANGVISKVRYKYKRIADRMIQKVFSIGSSRLNTIKKGKCLSIKTFKI